MTSIKQRFEEKYTPITETGCWIWMAALKGTTRTQSYGLFRIGSKIRKAHRVSWEIYKGKIPKGDGYHGICVCHKCDNPICVNPDHLFLGSMSDNNKDKVNKNRSPKGSIHHATKLTDRQVRAIKWLLGYFTQKEIAKMYNVSRQNIGDIHRGKTWSHINVPA